ncbi:MAG: EMC3/TMCO1 family protein [Candidatus Woesearchaeota archaeon]
MVLGFINKLFDFLFGPLLKLSPLLTVLVISFVISLLTVLIYKWTTNQQLMKQLKEELKAFQQKIRQLKDHPEEALEVQKKMMETNMRYMRHSFKPMLFTFLPIILLFGWMNAHLAYEPIKPGQEFSVALNFAKGTRGSLNVSLPEGLTLLENKTVELESDTTILRMKAEKEGRYLLEFDIEGKSYTKELLVSTQRVYAKPIESYRTLPLKSIRIGNPPAKLLNLGFVRLGWLWTYILFSITFSILLRKALRVY